MNLLHTVSLFTVSLLYLAVVSASAQTLLDAISKYTELSTFTKLYGNNTGLSGLLPSNSSISYTILIPSDLAFEAYEQQNSQSILLLAPSDLIAQFQYHILVGNHTSADFSQQSRGVTIPTLLTDEKYNNRSAGSALVDAAGSSEAAKGQVVVVQGDTGSRPGKMKFFVRQDTQTSVRSGMGEDAVMNAVDGVWEGGRFQIIDKFLTLPQPCTRTIRSKPALSTLDQALNLTSLWSALNFSPNITCLAPTNDAFLLANVPFTNNNATIAALTTALLFHTLAEPLYASFLVDGQTMKTLSNDTVVVTIRGEDTYFNNAKVTQADVLTNNGLVHVLDRVMAVGGTAPDESVSSTSASATGTVTRSVSSTGTVEGSATSTSGGATAASSSAGAAAKGGFEGVGAMGLGGLVGALMMAV